MPVRIRHIQAIADPACFTSLTDIGDSGVERTGDARDLFMQRVRSLMRQAAQLFRLCREAARQDSFARQQVKQSDIQLEPACSRGHHRRYRVLRQMAVPGIPVQIPLAHSRLRCRLRVQHVEKPASRQVRTNDFRQFLLGFRIRHQYDGNALLDSLLDVNAEFRLCRTYEKRQQQGTSAQASGVHVNEVLLDGK